MHQSEREEAWENLVSLLHEIDRAVDVLIVEGPGDEGALKALGIQKPMFRGSHLWNQADMIETIAQRFGRVLVLTDFDREGRSLNRRLTGTLEKRGLRVEKGYRKELGKLLGQLSISTIESLAKREELFFRVRAKRSEPREREVAGRR